MDKGGRGRGQPMWIIIKLYNIIIKSVNVDKGGGGGCKTLIHKMWIDLLCFFYPTRTSLVVFRSNEGYLVATWIIDSLVMFVDSGPKS